MANNVGIDKVKEKINNDIELTKKKLKTNSIFSVTVSCLIIILNLSIIGLATWALVELIQGIVSKQFNVSVIILPTMVALFTILLFVFSILITIYKTRTKAYFFKSILEEYQYLIINLREKNITVEEAVEILDEINNKKQDNEKLSTKKVIKNVLGVKDAWKNI